MITTFLDTCMKLLCDSKAMQGLQEIINRCTNKKNATDGPRISRNLGKDKARTSCEMRSSRR